MSEEKKQKNIMTEGLKIAGFIFIGISVVCFGGMMHCLNKMWKEQK